MIWLKLAQSILVWWKLVYFQNLCGVLGCGALVTYVNRSNFLGFKRAHLSSNLHQFRFYKHLKAGHWSQKSVKNESKVQVFHQDFDKDTTFSFFTICLETLQDMIVKKCVIFAIFSVVWVFTIINFTKMIWG